MKKRLRNNLVILLLINISFLSLLYYISSIRFETKKDNPEDSNSTYYLFLNQHFSRNSIELFSIDSTDNSHFIEISRFIEELLQDHEETFYILCLTGTVISVEFLLFDKYISKNHILGKKDLLKIVGVNVTEEEFRIFNLIQEYLNCNRVFNKEKVALYIKSRNKVNGNLNFNGITTVIESLIKKKIISEGSKLTRKTVLKNANRAQLYKFIKENPGIYKNPLAKMLNVCPFVIKWHLSMLLEFGLIRERSIKGRISYFDSFLSSEKDLVFYTISQEKCDKIIEFLTVNNKGFTKSQLSKALHMHYNTVTKYLNEIEKFGLLTKKNLNNNKELIYLKVEILNHLKQKSM
ncbi:MAG: hypothetical protein ACFFA3_09345 [Promethearchaeota archaeon]